MNLEQYKEVLSASQQWIGHFNKGNLDECINTYTDTATMQVHPYGLFEGKQAIGEFWREFVNSAKPTNLEYRNVQIRFQSDQEAVLSATWSMNVGSGFISKELWAKQEDGHWRLQEDDFSIVTVNETARNENDPLDTALVIVDLQNDYFDGGKMQLHKTEAAAVQAKKLLEHFRTTQQPIIHVQHIFESDTAPFFTPNSEGSEIHTTVAPQPGEDLIIKAAVNSFKDTILDNLLIEKGIKNLVITGAMAHMCIDAIVRHASDAGYTCTIIEDACAAPTIERNGETVSANQVSTAMMSAFEFAYGQVTSVARWLQQQD